MPNGEVLNNTAPSHAYCSRETRRSTKFARNRRHLGQIQEDRCRHWGRDQYKLWYTCELAHATLLSVTQLNRSANPVIRTSALKTGCTPYSSPRTLPPDPQSRQPPHQLRDPN